MSVWQEGYFQPQTYSLRLLVWERWGERLITLHWLDIGDLDLKSLGWEGFVCYMAYYAWSRSLCDSGWRDDERERNSKNWREEKRLVGSSYVTAIPCFGSTLYKRLVGVKTRAYKLVGMRLSFFFLVCCLARELGERKQNYHFSKETNRQNERPGTPLSSQVMSCLVYCEERKIHGLSR